jgi:hypothetical protein
VAAGEDQPEAVVGDHVLLLGLVVIGRGRRLQGPQLLQLLVATALAPEPVDRLVAGGGGDPGPRVLRNATLRPDLHGDQEGLLNRVLGEVEVAEYADQ